MRNVMPMTPTARRLKASAARQGAVLPLAAVMLIAFLAAAALAVDLAYIQLAETELRACLDGTARAGAQAISRGLTDAEVREEVKSVAAENTIGGEGLILSDEDIVLGNARVKNNGTYRFDAGAKPTNAIRVVGRRSRDSASGSVSSLLGGLFGQSSYDLERISAATIQDRDIVVVADRSSSMQGKDAGNHPDTGKRMRRIEALKLAVEIFRNVLDTTPERENIGLAAYDEYSRTLAPLDTEYTLFDQEIADMTTGGGTNIGLGIDEGMKVLREGRRAASPVMIVMTDGRHNASRDPEAAAADAVAEMPQLSIYTITFSPSAQIEPMQRVAAIGGGQHHHADDYEQLAKVFEHLARTAGSVLIE